VNAHGVLGVHFLLSHSLLSQGVFGLTPCALDFFWLISLVMSQTQG